MKKIILLLIITMTMAGFVYANEILVKVSYNSEYLPYSGWVDYIFKLNGIQIDELSIGGTVQGESGVLQVILSLNIGDELQWNAHYRNSVNNMVKYNTHIVTEEDILAGEIIMVNGFGFGDFPGVIPPPDIPYPD